MDTGCGISGSRARGESEADHSRLVRKSRLADLYLNSPIRLHGKAFNCKIKNWGNFTFMNVDGEIHGEAQ
jgi:hypothetical protein